MSLLVLVIVLIMVALAMGVAALHGLFQLAVFVCWVFGVVRSFQAHWLLGLIALFVAPVGVIVGVGCLLTHRNVGDDVVGAFRR